MAHIKIVTGPDGQLTEVGVFEPEPVAPSRPGVVESQRALDVEEPSAMDTQPEKPDEFAPRPTFPCEHCEFVAASAAGLSAHSRAKHKE